jgi:hypothetical protein
MANYRAARVRSVDRDFRYHPEASENLLMESPAVASHPLRLLSSFHGVVGRTVAGVSVAAEGVVALSLQPGEVSMVSSDRFSALVTAR